MTTKLEQAAQQVIDAWNYGSPFEKYLVALDEALAEQAEQEPVAWMDLHKELGKLRWMGGDEGWDNAINAVRDRLIELYTAEQPVSQEPVAVVDEIATRLDGTPIFNGVGKVEVGQKLYTAPQPVSQETDSVARDMQRNKAEREYFNARPQIDTLDRRNVFRAGFDSATAPQPVKEEIK